MSAFYLMQGDQVVDAKEHAKRSKKPSVVTAMNEQTVPAPKDDNPPKSEGFDIIQEAKRLYVKKVVGADIAAACIVGKLRAIFVNNYQHYPTTIADMELLNYMDKILFDMLKELLAGVVKYGKDAVPMSMINESIDNAVDAVEIQVDRTKMYELIREVYSIF